MLRVTRPSRRGVFAGLLAGGLLVGGLAFAAGENVIHLPVTIPAFHWQVDGQPVKTSDRPGFVHNGTAYVPSAFLYNGTTYVPIRFVSELLGYSITYDPQTKTISIDTKRGGKEAIPYRVIPRHDAPPDIQQWIDRHFRNEGAYVSRTADATYVLISRGEKPTAGYGIAVQAVTCKDGGIVVTVRTIDPQPGDIVAEVITYPHVVVKLDAQSKPIRVVTTDGREIPLQEAER
ncbi:protease complex subunit PrcB family protein [Calditerricola satsumensis]|uniref:Protease complex subunit PrcB family protein n=1 Tax=Calditerricola satsumensis TaxID=373054 RepID=A0A8J3BD96_9BACI|nr:protease complex subunit PrcB family protein [Calditerricola satsumensis]GGJ99789.1 hypothetical protein GCM10007043_12320 [Calditerricola satsumensis]